MRQNDGSQNLLKSVVQICHPASEEIVGTGFIVASDGLIATCCHVIDDAKELSSAGEEIVGVYFSQSRLRTTAHVLPDRRLPHDDVGILQLDIPLPEAVSSLLLGGTHEIEGHRCKCYGFRPLPPYAGGYAAGFILGKALREPDSLLGYDPLQIRSPEINQGMSGSPVLDLETNRVVGIITSTWMSKTAKDRDTAFATPAEALAQLIPNLQLTPTVKTGFWRLLRTRRNLRIVTAVFLLLVLSIVGLIWLVFGSAAGLGCFAPKLSYASSYMFRAVDYRDNGEYDCAVNDLLAALNTNPSTEEKAQIYYLLASVKLVQELPAEAVEYSDKGLALAQGSQALLHVAKGLGYCQMNQNARALQEFDEFLTLDGATGVPETTIQSIRDDISQGNDMSAKCLVEVSPNLP